jgi:hypothetical protein
VATTVVALPLILGVAACGADKADNSTTANAGGTPAPVVTTTAAPPKTAPPVAQLNRVTFVPAMNSALTKQKSWRITGKMTANGKTVLTMNGVQVAKPRALAIDMTGAAFGGGKGKIIVVRNTAYLSIPGLSPAGKYVKIDAAQARDHKVGGLGDLLDSGDPTKTFKSFGAALRGVKFVRSETIGGQKLDHYAVTVDTAKVLAALGKAVPADVPKTLTYSLWMDSAHLIRRMSFDLAGVSMLMTMTDFNQPVDISAPPASKVVSR